MWDGVHVGYYEEKVGFWPNPVGVKEGWKLTTWRPWKAFYKRNSSRIKIGNEVRNPFRNSIYINPTEIIDVVFWDKNVRTPRLPFEPKVAPPPIPDMMRENPKLMGKTATAIREILQSDAAEKEFRERWPYEEYKHLYANGNKARTLEDTPDERLKKKYDW